MTLFSRSYSILSLLLMLECSLAPHAHAAAPKVNFDRQIRSILSDTCFKCHGFDEKERQAGLRLDTQEGILSKGDSGNAAVVPGKSSESELYRRLTTKDATIKMPPPDSGRTLTPQQIELMQRWIDEGAEVTRHWSFTAPVQPQPPQVQREELVRTPIDRFWLKRLEQEGLKPSPLADKTTLIRRVTYDLTGLPPTMAEVDAFLADNSAQAYERLVDRLLSSPRYGEHMARYWLDAARYGDTHGLHLDNERSLWPYREWVIRAFNQNQPFNQFTIDQLAGDLVAKPTRDQQIATGFNRCNITTGEGGSIDDELRVRYAVDRVETTSTVWMGLTMGCSVCHDHKYDPISQKDFYRMYAFFNNNTDAPMDGNQLLPSPSIKLPDAMTEQKLTNFSSDIAATEKEIAAVLEKTPYVEPPAGKGLTGEMREFVWVEDELPEGAQPEGKIPWEFVSGNDRPVFSEKKSHYGTARGLKQHFFTDAKYKLTVGGGDKFFTYVYIDPKNPPREIMLQFHAKDWEHRVVWGEDVIPWGAPDSPSRIKMGALPEKGKWIRLEIEAARVGFKEGDQIDGVAFTQHDGAVYWDKMGIVSRAPQGPDSGFESLAAWMKYEATLTKLKAPDDIHNTVVALLAEKKKEADQLAAAQQKLATPATAPANAAAPPAAATPVVDPKKAEAEAAAKKDREAKEKKVRDYFMRYVALQTRPVLAPLNQKLEKLTADRKMVDDTVPATMVFSEMPENRDTFVLIRGAYDKKGEKVTANTPAVLPPLPMEFPKNRLGLATWLVSPQHPLTARVIVNRYWQQYFGAGIVKTAEDFGAQGERPKHPELLDWLATQFIATGWNVKDFQKMIVMSYVYQQSSHASPELIQKDPANELLTRGPRFRMDAEVLRDTALYNSGLLVEQVGGKSVKTYQPEGVWEAIAFVGSNTREFKQDHGQALYRRSMYTFWKRTCPPPSMLTFDAPSRENCTVRRARTNTPLQALVMMNDVQFMEAARGLAVRLLREGGATPNERLAYGFRLMTCRRPTEQERQVLQNIYYAHLAEYQNNPEAAKKLLSYGETAPPVVQDAGEMAALTMVSNLLLNLDEAVTKE